MHFRLHSNVACNPRTWTAKTWHHVQISYHRVDDVGTVTYDQVALDGVISNLSGATVNAALSLGWASVLLTNFQIDGNGAGPGAITIYVDNMSVYRW
jgi:hypothetical protein